MQQPVSIKETRMMLRKIRVLNGASAIIEVIKNQPFRYVFMGDMPKYVNGGRVPVGLDLILIPQPGTQIPPNITNLLCRHQSTKFKFALDHNLLRYVDLSGAIPAGRQNWCEVSITLIKGLPPPKFDLDNVVEIYGIPTIHVFSVFIDELQDLLNRYDSLQTQCVTKSLIKVIRTFTEPLSKAIPQNMDQACTALALSKQLLAILSGPVPPSNRVKQLTDCLRVISIKIENWVYTHHRSVNDDQATDYGTIQVSSPVTQEVDKGPEPSADEEDRDESDDWVEITISTGVIKNNSYCEEQADEALDFELLSID